MTSDPGAPQPREPRSEVEPIDARAEPESDAILPFGVGERLDEIAQDRFDRTDWIELVAAVLLALATIVAAWSAYQATRWGGEQAKASRAALTAKTDAAQQTTHLRHVGAGRRAALDAVAPAGGGRECRRF